jgi:hypothetical protein
MSTAPHSTASAIAAAVRMPAYSMILAPFDSVHPVDERVLASVADHFTTSDFVLHLGEIAFSLIFLDGCQSFGLPQYLRLQYPNLHRLMSNFKTERTFTGLCCPGSAGADA